MKSSEQLPNTQNNNREDREGDENTSEKIDDRYDKKIDNTSEKVEIENQDPDLGLLSEEQIKKDKKRLKELIEKGISKIKEDELKKQIREIMDKEKGE